MIATKTVGLITYTGFDPKNNEKRWIEEKGNYTYVNKQDNEWSISFVAIAAYDIDFLQEAMKHRYVTPPYSIERQIMNGKTAYHFWKGEEYWFFDKDEAIRFIYEKWDNE